MSIVKSAVYENVFTDIVLFMKFIRISRADDDSCYRQTIITHIRNGLIGNSNKSKYIYNKSPVRHHHCFVFSSIYASNCKHHFRLLFLRVSRGYSTHKKLAILYDGCGQGSPHRNINSYAELQVYNNNNQLK